MANNVSTQTAALATLPSLTKVATMEVTTNGHLQIMSLGGNGTTAVAAGTAANTVIKAASGYLARVLVTTAGTSVVLIYDNATTNSGTVIGVIPANSPAGSLLEFHMPAANGITVDGDAQLPAITVAWA